MRIICLFVIRNVLAHCGPRQKRIKMIHIFQVINYNYIYCVNLWLLLNPFWLCFDWSMGCIPLINSINDVRVLAPLLFWIFMAALVWKSYSTIDSHFGR